MRKKILLFYVIAFILMIMGFFFDEKVPLALSQIRTPFLNEFMFWFSFFGTWFFVLIFMTSLFLWQENKRKWILPLWFSVIASLAVTYFLKIILMRTRPDIALLPSSSSSFPSGHATAVFSTLAILDREFPKIRWFWLTFSLIVVLSRLYLGMHYLTDVVMGALIGYSVSLLVVEYKTRKTANKKLRKSKK
jgi:undecaprenyl-diphosphatase